MTYRPLNPSVFSLHDYFCFPPSWYMVHPLNGWLRMWSISSRFVSVLSPLLGVEAERTQSEGRANPEWRDPSVIIIPKKPKIRVPLLRKKRFFRQMRRWDIIKEADKTYCVKQKKRFFRQMDRWWLGAFFIPFWIHFASILRNEPRANPERRQSEPKVEVTVCCNYTQKNKN